MLFRNFQIEDYYAPTVSLNYETISKVSLGNFDIDSLYSDYLPFIPTASALAFKRQSSNCTRPYYNAVTFNRRNTIRIHVPFDSYYLNDLATEHISLDTNMVNWLGKVVNMKIDGPISVVDSVANYSLKDEDGTTIDNSYIQWSIKNTSATINSNGILNTNHSYGFADVKARFLYNDNYIFKKKRILVGLPHFYLHVFHSSGYQVRAICTNPDEQPILDSLLQSGVIKMKWGIKIGDSPIEWSITNSLEKSVIIPSEDVTCDVYCNAIITESGQQVFPTALNIHFLAALPFEPNIEMLETTSMEVSFYYTNNHSEWFAKGSNPGPNNPHLPYLWLHKNPNNPYNVCFPEFCHVYGRYGIGCDSVVDPHNYWGDDGELIYAFISPVFNSGFFWTYYFDYRTAPVTQSTEEIITILIKDSFGRPIQNITFPIFRWVR